jgi:hypothetical protein
MRYQPSVEHGQDLIDFMWNQVHLDLRQQPIDGPNWFCTVVRDTWAGNIIVAGLACEFKTSFDVHFSAAIADPGAISRRLMRGIFRSLFTRAVRITALVDPRDAHANAVVQRLGFVYEGFLRMGLDGYHDANLYGMLAQDCKYLTGVRAARSVNGGGPNGQSTETAESLRAGIGTAGG